MNIIAGGAQTAGYAAANFASQQEENRVEILSRLRFSHPMRKYQQEILQLVNDKVANGEREIHVVAPPGAGKTIIGLQMVLNFGRPSLILAPNTTIQSQWSQKLSLFLPPELKGYDLSSVIGTHEDRPLKPITVLTYQVLSTPGREQEYLAQLAQKEWVNELRGARALSVGEAELRILELMQNNPKAHQQEMSRHLSRVRRKLTDVLRLEDVLHKNALELFQSLRREGVGLVIFDECHHLTDYWAAIMAHLLKMLEEPVRGEQSDKSPIVVALTGTPPEGKTSSQENRYMSLVGGIDYQVPTAALVREGGLAPFQDLVYFTEPTAKELAFLESQHEDFHSLVEELIGLPPDTATSTPLRKSTVFTTRSIGESKYDVVDQNDNISPLLTWVLKRTIDATQNEGWDKFAERRPGLSLAVLRCLYKYNLPFPRNVQFNEEVCQSPVIDEWMLLLDDFASEKLKVSSSSENHQLFERIKTAARKLGFGITERGLRRQASPADRVLAFSESKAKAVAEILAVEYGSLEDRLRAIVVTDFERMSATGLKAVKGVLDEESGGALGALRVLLGTAIANYVNPCLVTGSLLLVDKRITDRFVDAAKSFLQREGIKLELTVTDLENEPFSQITAASSDWDTKLYVRMATELFEKGISKCLIGTRGLFGEGWDSQALNTLLDLTTTTAPVSVKQLRGRSIRIQTNDPLGGQKVANNWDIVCVAPQLEKGLNDYNRFARKHEGFFGVADDGQIERGVGHVHPALSELTAIEVFNSYQKFNHEMTARALMRNQIYELWKVGNSYENKMLGCVEVSALKAPYLTPPYLRRNLQYKDHAGDLRCALLGVWAEYAGVGAGLSALLACVFQNSSVPLALATLPFAAMLVLAQKKYRRLRASLKHDICSKQSSEENLRTIASAVLSALKRIKLLPRHATTGDIMISERSNGCFRVFLDNVDYAHSKIFVDSVQEAFRPVTNQPFVVPRHEFRIPVNDAANLPLSEKDRNKVEDQFFNQYVAGKLKPTLAGYHAVPPLLARSEKGKDAFQTAWNKYVSPGELIQTESNSKIVNKYFGLGPSLAKRLLWE